MLKAVIVLSMCTLISAGCVGQSIRSTGPSKAYSSTDEEISARLDGLQQYLETQSQEIKQLQQQVQSRDSLIQELRQQLSESQSNGANSQHTQEETRDQKGNSELVGSSVPNQVSSVYRPDVHTNATASDGGKVQSASENPTTIRYKGVTLAPGGFFDATAIYRTHNQNADVISTFGNIPFSGSANSHLSEFRGTGRATRLSLLAEGSIKGWKTTGYLEVDFAGAAPTGNEIESNSFQPRSRQLWGQVESKKGVSFAAGQTWSLLTTNRKGIALREEWVPMTIDLQYVAGYNWARQWSARVTKNFHDRVWASVSVENPETTINTVNAPPGVFGLNTSVNSTSPVSGFTLSNTPGANGISTDATPDFIGKLAFEPGWGHFELKALGRVFRDRFNGTNNYITGGGGGIAAILPITKKVDVIMEGMAGDGIGRYASGLGADVTARPDGTIVPIRTSQLMAGVEAHPESKLDLYLYGGDEYYSRTSYLNSTGQPVGYGSSLNDNSGCQVETPTSSQPCQAQNRSLWQIEPGFWYRFYKGRSGTLAMGASYSYIYRNTWSGLNSAQPKGIENMIMTSFRYYIP